MKMCLPDMCSAVYTVALCGAPSVVHSRTSCAEAIVFRV